MKLEERVLQLEQRAFETQSLLGEYKEMIVSNEEELMSPTEMDEERIPLGAVSHCKEEDQY